MTATINADEVSACLRRYGMRACAVPRPLTTGHTGDVTMVHTNQGSVAIKRFSRRFDAGRCRLAAQAHDHAARAGLAPLVRRTLDSQLVAEIAEATYLVADYIDGTTEPEPPAFAAGLAALHRRLDTFTPGTGCSDFLELNDPPEAALEDVRACTRDEACRAAVDWRLQVLNDFGLEPDSMATLERRWVHGDARPDNLLSTCTSQRRMFIDFDQVSRFFPAYEVVRAYAASLCDEPSAQSTNATYRAFLGAYHAVNPIPVAHRSLMIDLFITIQAAETRTFTTPESDVRGMAEFTMLRHRKLKWIVQHRDLLRQATVEICR